MSFLANRAYDVGTGLASLVWPFLGRRRRIATENILRAGVTGDPAEARRIAKASFRHFAGHIAEALCVPFVVNASNWREHLDFTEAAPETVKLLLDTPDRPVILASSHHGVWEAATNVLSFARPMIAIARVQNNKLAERLIRKFHFRGPVTVIDKNRGFTSAILRQWKSTAAAMTILMDQYTWNGAPLRFFGRPAKTYTSVTRLAMRTGYPVVVGSFVRLAPYRYGLVGGEPLAFSKGDDVQAKTQILNDRLEAAIRLYPEQYLWIHRRWRDD